MINTYIQKKTYIMILSYILFLIILLWNVILKLKTKNERLFGKKYIHFRIT